MPSRACLFACLVAMVAASACGGAVSGEGGAGGAGAAAGRTDAATACGNGAFDPGEQCDGEDLFRATCATLGFVGGTLTCDPVSCTFDTRRCTPSTCGNDQLEPGEECDGIASNIALCAGSLTEAVPCDRTTCKLDRSRCAPTPSCGNGSLEPGEQCDGADWQTQRCEELGYGFSGGTLACDTSTCTLNLSSCTRDGAACGNGVAEGEEQCDGADLMGNTCRSRGFMDGVLRCDPVACILLTTECYNPCGVSRFGYTCQ